MVRLTADVLQNCFARINPCLDRELDIRGLKVPAIENIGVTKDQYDTLDFSDNEIKKLENFPRFSRLSTLLLNNNHIARISPTLGEQLLSLQTIILTNNRVAQLSEVDHLVGCTKLTTLSLVNNPVARRQHYRLYVIHKLPSVKVLDFSKVKPQERADAARLFKSAAGKLMQQDVDAEASTFTPGEDMPSNPMANFTEEQMAQVRAVIAAATTPEEVDRVERQLKAGIIPSLKKPEASAASTAPPPPPPPPPPVATTPPTATATAAPPAREPAPPPPAPTATPGAQEGDTKMKDAEVPAPHDPVPSANASPAAVAAPSSESEAMDVEAAAPDGAEAAGEDNEDEAGLTAAEVKAMKVAELKAELKNRGESTSGLKKDLQARLLALI